MSLFQKGLNYINYKEPYDKRIDSNLKEYVEDELIRHQNDINNNLMGMLKEKGINGYGNLKNYQSEIAYYPRHVYKLKQIQENNRFTDDDFVFILIAMIQVIFSYIYL